jgi:hypothetical protein
MSAIFYEGEPVIAQRDHTQRGRIEFIRNDGRLQVRWADGYVELVRMDDLALAPGYKRTSRRRTR